MAMHELPHGLLLTQCGISEKERAGLRRLDADARRDLNETLEERYGRRSTILTSQIPVDKWHAFIGDSKISYASFLD